MLRPPLRLLPVALLLGLALLVAGSETGGGDAAPFDLSASGATGGLTTSRGGGAILRATNMRPGQTVGGAVTIRSGAQSPAQLVLSQRRVRDRPGPGGGRLSSRLRLAVEDVTDRPRVVYSGVLGAMPRVGVGQIAKRHPRRYRFTVRLPSGPNDDRFQGASMTVDYVWRAAGGPLRMTGADCLSSGNDVIVGTPGDDVICTGAGADVVDGRGGNDVIDLGSGDDVGRGGPGDDRILGRSGDDRLWGGPGADRLWGGSGRDRLDGRWERAR